MNNIFTKFGNEHIRVVFTNHAKQRLIQRFKLYLHQHERENPERFLQFDFKKSKVDMAFHMCAGKVNMQESRYGKDYFMSESEYMKYYGNYVEDQNIFLIKTIFPVSR